MSGPRHGYEILQFMDKSLGASWYVGTSHLYNLLKRLERDGLVVSRIKPQETRPSKRIFSLTQEGEKAFVEWVQSPTDRARDLRIEFLGKLFFIKYLSLDVGAELVAAQVQVLKRTKERLQARHHNEKDDYNALVYGFKLATVEAWIKWMEREATNFVRKIE